MGLVSSSLWRLDHGGRGLHHKLGISQKICVLIHLLRQVQAVYIFATTSSHDFEGGLLLHVVGYYDALYYSTSSSIPVHQKHWGDGTETLPRPMKRCVDGHHKQNSDEAYCQLTFSKMPLVFTLITLTSVTVSSQHLFVKIKPDNQQEHKPNH